MELVPNAIWVLMFVSLFAISLGLGQWQTRKLARDVNTIKIDLTKKDERIKEVSNELEQRNKLVGEFSKIIREVREEMSHKNRLMIQMSDQMKLMAQSIHSLNGRVDELEKKLKVRDYTVRSIDRRGAIRHAK